MPSTSTALKASAAGPCEAASPAPNVCVLGGALSTGNLGVSALGVATVKGILQAMPGARILLQDWGKGNQATLRLGDRSVTLETTALHNGKSFRMTAGTRHLGFLATVDRCLPRWLGRRLCRVNPHYAKLADIDFALALCGGDSFSDIYGEHVLRLMSTPLLLMAQMEKPLVLMPQTLGPFQSPRSLDLARRVLGHCELVATRGIGGLEELRATLGGWVPDRVVECPDVAFTLDPVAVAPESEPFVLDQADNRPLVGLNISGLLYLSEQGFGFQESYPRLIHEIAEWVLACPDRRLLLVPHVISHTPPDQASRLEDRSGDVSDTAACDLVYREMAARFPGRVGCLSWPHTESETKYLIGQCDFVIGARMHACIAGISQCVPTVTLAYSKKAHGVMGHLGACAPVVDLRESSIDECIRGVAGWFEQRAELRSGLQETVPEIRAEVERFFVQQLRPMILRAHAAAGLARSRTSEAGR